MDPVVNYQGLSLLASLAFAAAGVLCWWGALRFLDRLAGGWRHFRKAGGPLDHIAGGNLAAGVYYGLRLLAAAVVVGLVLASVRF